MTVSETQRNRLLTIARTLRRFRLVDNFGLGESVQRNRLPSRANVERLISENTTLLPPGVTARFIADQIIADLEGAELTTVGGYEDLSKLVAVLPKVPKGQRAATRYQMAILAIFRLLFDGGLGRLKPEVTIFSGIKRVDILADNDQQAGFFVALRTRYDLLCPYILFECKNYTKEPGNPEFDQLLARLNDTSTGVGCVVCRELKDVTRVRQRCKEAFLREHRNKLMLWLTDADISELANGLMKQGISAVDALLQERLESVILK